MKLSDLTQDDWLYETDNSLIVGTHEYNFDEDDLYEMANVRQKWSGLPVVMYISSKDAALGRHGPRVKVSNNRTKWDPNDNFVITVPELRVKGNPTFNDSELEDIKDWIQLNQKLILQYWSKEINDDVELLTSLRKL